MVRSYEGNNRVERYQVPLPLQPAENRRYNNTVIQLKDMRTDVHGQAEEVVAHTNEANEQEEHAA